MVTLAAFAMLALPVSYGPTTRTMSAPEVAKSDGESSDSCSPSSLFMPLTAPNVTAAAGSKLSSTFEFRIVNYQASMGAVGVYLPRIFSKFPVAGASPFQMSVAPEHVVLTNGSWSPASEGTASKTLAGATAFTNNAPANLTSELIAVMATTTHYEGTNLTFRWSWNLTSDGVTTGSAWSENTDVGRCPSDFWPAPYVDLVQDWNTTAPAGAYFTAELEGYVAGQYFLLETETSSGHVVYSNSTTLASDIGSIGHVSIAYDCWCGSLAPGNYLAHIHNVMGALLYSISVTVTASSATTPPPAGAESTSMAAAPRAGDESVP